MNAEIAALLALGQSRRAAGLPCNPRRDGLTDADWLSLEEVDTLHCLGLRIAINEAAVLRSANWLAAGVSA